MDAQEAARFTQLNVEESLDRIQRADLDELEDIMDVERQAKNRKTVKQAIEDEIHRRKVKESISEAEHMLDEVAQTFSDIEELEHLDPSSDDLSEEDVINFVTGTVEEAENMLKNNSYSADELSELLQAEKAGKDRKTLSVTLHQRIREAEEVEDFEEAEQKLREIENAMKRVEEQEEKPSHIKEREESNETREEKGGQEREAEDKGEKNTERTEEETGVDEQADNENSGDGADEEGDLSDQEDGEDAEVEDTGSRSEDEGNEKDEVDLESGFDRDAAIEELSDKFSDEKLQKASDDDLKNLLAQERHRRDLIESLEGEFDREALEEVTIDDLEALKSDLESSSEKDEEPNKEEDEMKEEAEEDLRMLMGAGSEEDKDETEDSEGAMERFKKNIHDKYETITTPPGQSPGEGRDRSDKALDLLQGYQELGEEEAAIKTAHVMKGYLEHILSIRREMTYMELAGELEEEDEIPDQLVNFFEEMNERQYTGRIQGLDVDRAIENSIDVVKELS